MPRSLVLHEEDRMADLLTDDGRGWVVDDQRLLEITLLTDVMIEATARSGPLTQLEIDALLSRAPLVPPEWPYVPHPRREDELPAR
jgi:hypothetical protein